MSSTELKCAVCESGNLVAELSTRKMDLEGQNVDVPSRHHWCNSCGVIQALDDDLRFNARAKRAVMKQLRGMQTGAEVREVRKALCLKQEEAARLFGGGPVAFSKYENDEIIPSEAMDRLIWLAGRFPWIVGALAKRLAISLSEEAILVIQQCTIAYEQEYLAEAQARFCSARNVTKGFSKIVSSKRHASWPRDKAINAVELIVH